MVATSAAAAPYTRVSHALDELLLDLFFATHITCVAKLQLLKM